MDSVSGAGASLDAPAPHHSLPRGWGDVVDLLDGPAQGASANAEIDRPWMIMVGARVRERPAIVARHEDAHASPSETSP